jgi:quercetin dioxygenase-like cupin family protein
VIPGSVLYVYSKAEQGDHFLAFKNPFKFTKDLQAFLGNEKMVQAGEASISGETQIQREELLRTNEAWNDVPYGIYPPGPAEPVVARLTIPAHGQLPWHAHPMPSFAYVLAGEILWKTSRGTRSISHKGMSCRRP